MEKGAHRWWARKPVEFSDRLKSHFDGVGAVAYPGDGGELDNSIRC